MHVPTVPVWTPPFARMHIPFQAAQAFQTAARGSGSYMQTADAAPDILHSFLKMAVLSKVAVAADCANPSSLGCAIYTQIQGSGLLLQLPKLLCTQAAELRAQAAGSKQAVGSADTTGSTNSNSSKEKTSRHSSTQALPQSIRWHGGHSYFAESATVVTLPQSVQLLQLFQHLVTMCGGKPQHLSSFSACAPACFELLLAVAQHASKELATCFAYGGQPQQQPGQQPQYPRQQTVLRCRTSWASS